MAGSRRRRPSCTTPTAGPGPPPGQMLAHLAPQPRGHPAARRQGARGGRWHGRSTTRRPAELYDPDTGTWTAIANMHARKRGHRGHAAARRQGARDGRCWTTGPMSAELYDPATGTWTATGDFARPGAHYGSATLLSDGTVLVAARLPSPSCTTRAPGPGPPPRHAPGARRSPARCCSMARSSWQVARDCLDGVCVATGSAELYVPAGVSPPPLPAFPSPPPPVFPTPTPIPTPVPPEAGPVPPDARTWKVTVVNRSSEPATLFVAEEDERVASWGGWSGPRPRTSCHPAPPWR